MQFLKSHAKKCMKMFYKQRAKNRTLLKNVSRNFKLALKSKNHGKASWKCRYSPPELFLQKGVLKIYSKVTEHTCRSAISLRHGCFPVNLLHIFRTHFPKNISEGRLLKVFTRIKILAKKFLALLRIKSTFVFLRMSVIWT